MQQLELVAAALARANPRAGPAAATSGIGRGASSGQPPFISQAPATMGKAGWLAYSTPKMIVIEEKKLGIMHYTFLFFTAIIYVGLYTVIMRGGYMLHETPIGTVKLSIQAPVVNGCSPGPKDPSCNYDFSDTKTLAYCTSKSTEKCDKKNAAPSPPPPPPPMLGTGGATASAAKSRQLSEGTAPPPPSPPTTHAEPVDKCPCRIEDELEVAYPVTGGTPFFVTTRVLESDQQDACAEHATTCKQTYTTNTTSSSLYFVADIENFTLMIDHAAYSPTGAFVCDQGTGSNSADMAGADGTPDTGGPLQYGLKSTKPPLTSPPWFGTVPSGTKPGYHTLSSGVTEIIPRQNSKRQDVFTVGIYFVQLLALFH
jgi:hypothetical protein